MQRFLFLLALAAFVGCDAKPTAPTTPATQKLATEHADDHDGDDHDDHDRGTMSVAHLGKYHALLTAHISPKGNELDIFIETTDKEPKPVAVALTELKGIAYRDKEEFELTFVPAPASERPAGEAAGTCSHFVAKAPFLKPDETITVVVKTELDGRQRKATWKDFDVKKYTHHAE